MQKTITQERVSLLRPLAPAAPDAERVVSVTVVYEDAGVCEWARETCEQMFVGPGWERAQSTWWKMDGLSAPAVLAGAVSQAMRADLIVVAIRATEGFPLPFYVWVSSWLPHRLQGEGKLVALIASPKPPGCQRHRAMEYLSAVAQRARMHFQVTERNLALDALETREAESQDQCPVAVPAPKKKPTALLRYSSRRWGTRE
jgi:hypothetical protein